MAVNNLVSHHEHPVMRRTRRTEAPIGHSVPVLPMQFF
jgi:hypothetical protein